MGQDPRLNSLVQYAMTAVSPGPADVDAQLRQRVENLERVLGALLRTPAVQTGSGAPTQAARDGTLYVDITNSRLFARSAGVWKFTAIT